MRSKEEQKRYEELTKSLSQEDYDKLEGPTREQIREALRKGAEDLRKATRYRQFNRVYK